MKYFDQDVSITIPKQINVNECEKTRKRKVCFVCHEEDAHRKKKISSKKLTEASKLKRLDELAKRAEQGNVAAMQILALERRNTLEYWRSHCWWN